MNPELAGLIYVTVAGIATFPLAAKTPRSLGEMVRRLDEDLSHRVSSFVCAPHPDTVPPWVIIRAIGGLGGLPHILSQARLMTGIVVEAKKGNRAAEEVAEMRAKTWALWRAAAACLLLPTVHAYNVATILSDMSGILENVLIEIDTEGMRAI